MLQDPEWTIYRRRASISPTRRGSPNGRGWHRSRSCPLLGGHASVYHYRGLYTKDMHSTGLINCWDRRCATARIRVPHMADRAHQSNLIRCPVPLPARSARSIRHRLQGRKCGSLSDSRRKRGLGRSRCGGWPRCEVLQYPRRVK